MHKLLITISLVMLCMTAQVQAQTDGFSVNLGMTMPTKFATSAKSDAPLGWGTGFSVGFRFQHSIGTGKLHYFADVDIRHNGMSGDAESMLNTTKQTMDNAFGYDQHDGTSSIKGSTYWSIPMLGGLNYSYPVGKSLSLWGEVGTGIVYQIITDQTYNGHYSYSQSGTAAGYHYTNTYTKKTDMVTSFDNAIHWALHWGIGVSLSKRLSIGINYDWFFGKSTMRSEYTTVTDKDYNSGAGHNHTSSTDHPDPTVITSDAASSAMFTFKLGYSF